MRYLLYMLYNNYTIRPLTGASTIFRLFRCTQSGRCNSNVANGNARFSVPFPSLYRSDSCTLFPSLFVLSKGCIYMYAFLYVPSCLFATLQDFTTGESSRITPASSSSSVYDTLIFTLMLFLLPSRRPGSAAPTAPQGGRLFLFSRSSPVVQLSNLSSAARIQCCSTFPGRACGLKFP